MCSAECAGGDLHREECERVFQAAGCRVDIKDGLDFAREYAVITTIRAMLLRGENMKPIKVRAWIDIPCIVRYMQ